MLYKNTKHWFTYLMDTDIVAEVLEGDTLAPYLFILCLDCTSNINRSNKRKWFLKVFFYMETIFPQKLTYADDIVFGILLGLVYLQDVSTQAQAESLLHSLKPAAGSIGLYGNTNKMGFISLKWQASKNKTVLIPWLQHLIFDHMEV